MSSSEKETAFKPPPPLPFYMKLAVGGVAGIFGTAIIYPIDVVKTRLQSGGSNSSSLGGSKPTIRSTINLVIQRDGFRGFYRGLSANLSGILFEKGIKLALNDYAREFFVERNNGAPILLHQEILSGAAAGVGQIVATNPVEVIKINLQLQSDLPQHLRKSPMGVIRDLGLRGVFKGSMSTLARDIPFSVIFFPMVSNLRILFGVTPEKQSVFANLMAGIVAGAFCRLGHPCRCGEDQNPGAPVQSRWAVLPQDHAPHRQGGGLLHFVSWLDSSSLCGCSTVRDRHAGV